MVIEGSEEGSVMVSAESRWKTQCRAGAPASRYASRRYHEKCGVPGHRAASTLTPLATNA
jgi:hypothetical protein